MAVLIGVAILLSEARGSINYVNAARALALQIAVAVLALVTPVGQAVLQTLSSGVVEAISYANEGISFVFGPLADPASGLILALQVLPVIIFIATIMAVLFHIGVMTWVIRIIGGALRFLTGASRLESTCGAANIFVGMAESPLTVLPYLPKISRAQLFVMMSLGLSSVAGTVLVAYSALGIRSDLLLTAAFMAPAGGILFGRMLVPETGVAFDLDDDDDANPASLSSASSLIEAATDGATLGMQIMLSVISVLIGFIAGIALLNGILGGVGSLLGFSDLSLELLIGYAFAPISYIIGVPWEETTRAGVFLGQKVVLNEFLAYANFAPVADEFSAQGQIALTIAMCGFANFGGLAILIAGLGAAVPERKAEISKLGIKALLAGTLSNFTSAAIVSVIFALGGFA
ncbi:nucleoside transporter C-terminal domain-containing protein [uncultured Erythrobacter sp.]|uniref:NupC/NupG family nucleoside CNT transporter n=1 Tax=uncultured Erythrobacter sp. TaxID=263913 RepID=UPI0026348198|nr:nucleoside transporter C-terminal domain-containing protein [uncultured Erythrobacter sp.]